MNTFRCRLASVAAFGLLVLRASASMPDQDLRNAFTNLVSGRDYLVNFPQTKTRVKLIQDYLGSDANGYFDGKTGKFNELSAALEYALQVRNSPAATADNLADAQIIAWEALEALLSGQLYSGNSDLLNGLRVAFPVAVSGKPPGTDRPMPLGVPVKTADQSEYVGANLKTLGYARLHFFRGISSLLDFLAADPTGNIRVVDYLTYAQAPTYTVFNTTNLSAGFTDPNYLAGPQPTQTAGYLYGNILNRYGMTYVSIADRLWRAAFFSSMNKPVREEMLDKASTEIRRGIHATFLASLPLAATLADDSGTTEENVYQVARLEQVRSSTASALDLMERINRREPPKLDALKLNVGDADLQTQISDTASLLTSLEGYHNDAKRDIERLEQANALQAGDVQSTRSQFEDEMVRICGLDPSSPPYNGLTDAATRKQYREDVQILFAARMTAGLYSESVVDGTDLGKAAIGVLRAFNDIRAATVEMDSIPQQIQIEEDRNEEVNAVVVIAGTTRTAVQLAIAVAEASTPKTLIGYPVSGLIFDPSPLEAAPLQQLEALINIGEEVAINSINSRATIRNLLLRQRELAQKMPSVVAQARLAVADMNELHNRLMRLIDNHVFFQNNTANLWYKDPSVVFEQSQAETRYKDALQAATIQLYVLAQKLASRWAEPYQNPYRTASGSPPFKALGPESFDDFTEPESAFTIVDTDMAKKCYRALQAWDAVMRTQERPFPAGAIEPTTISLRQDLLGLCDYEWSPQSSTFVLNPDRQTRNIGIFRAYLMNSEANVAPKNLFELEFGINYFSPKRSIPPATGASLYLVPRSSDQWNQRLTSVKAWVLGNNVTAWQTVPFTIYQYGKAYTQGFFDKDDAAHVDNLALYYRDPRTLAAGVPWEGKQQFIVYAAAGGTQPTAAVVDDRAMTPFCDRYLLTIEKSLLAAPVNLENITDIKFEFTWSVGRPGSFTWPTVP